MVMCKLYRNVLIRWDKDFDALEKTTLLIDGNDPPPLDIKKKIVSEVIMYNDEGKQIKFEI